MTPVRRGRALALCRAHPVRPPHLHSLSCDKPAGHDGPHRAYHDTADEVLFWDTPSPEPTRKVDPQEP